MLELIKLGFIFMLGNFFGMTLMCILQVAGMSDRKMEQMKESENK